MSCRCDALLLQLHPDPNFLAPPSLAEQHIVVDVRRLVISPWSESRFETGLKGENTKPVVAQKVNGVLAHCYALKAHLESWANMSV